MSVVAKGPVRSDKMVYRRLDEMTASLRALKDYHIGTDGYVLWLDVKVDKHQFHAGFFVRATTTLQGERIGAGDELIMPNKYEGLAVAAHPDDIIAALRGLADALEQQTKAVAEVEKLHND